MKNIKTFFKKVTLVFLVLLFCGINFSYAASVDVGEDIDLSTPISDDLHLGATISGFDLCDMVDYKWAELSGTLFIEMPYEKDMAMIYSNDLNDHFGTYTINLKAICNGGDPTYGGFIEEDEFILTIGTGSSSSTGTVNPTIHHRSHSSRMRYDAIKVFKYPKKIKLKLKEEDEKNKYFYKLIWNYVGGDGQINYQLEYSNTKDFKKYKKISTKSRFYNFSKSELEESEIYFFRVKAIYKNKESPFSNILSIVNKDNPLKDFQIECVDCNRKINYGDVFDTVDLLIEKKLNIKCKDCKRNKLKYLYSDIFIYNKKFELQVDKNKYCRTKINFEDVFNYKKGLDFKVECNQRNKNKINYNDLLK